MADFIITIFHLKTPPHARQQSSYVSRVSAHITAVKESSHWCSAPPQLNTQTRSRTWCVHRISHRDINPDRIFRASFIARNHSSRGIIHRAAQRIARNCHRAVFSIARYYHRAALSIARYRHRAELSIARHRHRAVFSIARHRHRTASHSIIHGTASRGITHRTASHGIARHLPSSGRSTMFATHWTCCRYSHSTGALYPHALRQNPGKGRNRACARISLSTRHP
jgi:hypothetical protein